MAEETPRDACMACSAEDVNAWVAAVVAALQQRLITDGGRTQSAQPVDPASLAVLAAYLFSLIGDTDRVLPIQRLTPYYQIFCHIGWDPQQLLPLWNHVAQVIIQHRVVSEPTQDILPPLQRLLQDATALHMLASRNVCVTDGAPVLKRTLQSDQHTVLPFEEPSCTLTRQILLDPTPDSLYDDEERHALEIAG